MMNTSLKSLRSLEWLLYTLRFIKDNFLIIFGLGLVAAIGRAIQLRVFGPITPLSHTLYVWVQGEQRNYYLLSVIDVYSRKILDWLFQGSIRQVDLINLLRRVNQSRELKGVILRNDNGSHRGAGAFHCPFSA